MCGAPAEGFSVKQHLLTEYLRAMGAICVAQLFKYKRLEGGKKGVERLSESPEICKLLGSIGETMPLSTIQGQLS